MIDETTVRRRKAFTLKDVKELDAFPKVDETYKETRVSGGGGMIYLHMEVNTYMAKSSLSFSQCH